MGPQGTRSACSQVADRTVPTPDGSPFRRQAVQMQGAAGGAERAHSDVRKRAPDAATRQMGRMTSDRWIGGGMVGRGRIELPQS